MGSFCVKQKKKEEKIRVPQKGQNSIWGKNRTSSNVPKIQKAQFCPSRKGESFPSLRREEWMKSCCISIVSKVYVQVAVNLLTTQFISSDYLR